MSNDSIEDTVSERIENSETLYLEAQDILRRSTSNAEAGNAFELAFKEIVTADLTWEYSRREIAGIDWERVAVLSNDGDDLDEPEADEGDETSIDDEIIDALTSNKEDEPRARAIIATKKPLLELAVEFKETFGDVYHDEFVEKGDFTEVDFDAIDWQNVVVRCDVVYQTRRQD